MVDVTAKATVYPSANDVAVVAKEGRFATEQTHTDYFRHLMEDHILSGFLLPAGSGTLTLTVPLGVAAIDGRRVEIASSMDIVLPASQTNHIYLQLSFDGNGDVDGVDLVSNITGVQPSNSVKLGEAITGVGTVTSTYDGRIFHPVARVSQQFSIDGGFINQTSTTDAVFVRGAIMRLFVPYATERVRMLVNIARLGGGGQGEARLRVDDVNAVTRTGTAAQSVGAGSAVALEVDVSGYLKRFAGEYLELSIEFRQLLAGGGNQQVMDDDGALTGLNDVHPCKFFAESQAGRD